METNYHSHTRWSRHGSGEIEDYIKEAIRNNIKVYGVSEHIPYPKLRSFRMYDVEIDDFMKELDELIFKYQDQITILKGLECEYFPEYHDYYLNLKEKYNLDYLILGHHFEDSTFKKDFFVNHSDAEIIKYKEGLLKGINSGLFDLIAHPDIYINKYPYNKTAKQIAQEIFKTCEEKNIPVEINANGLRYNKGYPNWDFWKDSTKYNLKYMINSDCHHPHEVLDQAVKDTYAKAKDLNINISEYLH